MKRKKRKNSKSPTVLSSGFWNEKRYFVTNGLQIGDGILRVGEAAEGLRHEDKVGKHGEKPQKPRHGIGEADYGEAPMLREDGGADEKKGAKGRGGAA